jgi:hypothetical protein
MKKLVYLLLILTISTGCFFNQKKLNCSGNIDLGNTKINNEYNFTYKKDKINKIELVSTFDCKSEYGKKVYESYIDKYKSIKNINIEINKEECLIEISTKKINEKVLNELNFGFLEDTSFDEAKKNLNDTQYICK